MRPALIAALTATLATPALADVPCGFLAVPRLRGQQLKDPNELDPWANDGSKEYVAGLCDFG